jgi:starch synthase
MAVPRRRGSHGKYDACHFLEDARLWIPLKYGYGKSHPIVDDRDGHMAQDPLKICLVTSELTPLAKTGGLADVCAALSAYFHDQRHDVRVLMPMYASIDTSNLDVVPVQNMQNRTLYLGHHRFDYSIDAATLPGTGLRIYLLRCPALYDRPGIYTGGPDEHLRFIALSRAAIEMCQHMGFAPDIFHCHDWHTALVPLYLKSLYAWDGLFAETQSVLTIHNIAYQGVFGADILHDTGLQDHHGSLHQEDLDWDRINFLKTGVLYADLLTTVSPTYAEEILGPEYGMGLQDLLQQRRDSLVGILNGVDYGEWDPRSDPLIPCTYNARNTASKTANKAALMRELGLTGGHDQPLIGMVTRLTSQKGLDLVQQVLPAMLRQNRFSLAVLGSGETRYEQFFHWLQQSFPGQVCFWRGYNNRLAHGIEAGSDLFLMPSLFEPCGLNQMYSLRYGTPPIVRRTGGLADSVQLFDPHSGQGNGIVFDHYDAPALHWAIDYALWLYRDKRTWRKLMQNGMRMNYSWQRQGEIYVERFRKLAGR